jgi:hypothetical protein
MDSFLSEIKFIYNQQLHRLVSLICSIYYGLFLLVWRHGGTWPPKSTSAFIGSEICTIQATELTTLGQK